MEFEVEERKLLWIASKILQRLRKIMNQARIIYWAQKREFQINKFNSHYRKMCVSLLDNLSILYTFTERGYVINIFHLMLAFNKHFCAWIDFE